MRSVGNLSVISKAKNQPIQPKGGCQAPGHVPESGWLNLQSLVRCGSQPAARTRRRQSRRAGRRADFTSENILRALLAHAIEGGSFRDTERLIAESEFLQDFV